MGLNEGCLPCTTTCSCSSVLSKDEPSVTQAYKEKMKVPRHLTYKLMSLNSRTV